MHLVFDSVLKAFHILQIGETAWSGVSYAILALTCLAIISCSDRPHKATKSFTPFRDNIRALLCKLGRRSSNYVSRFLDMRNACDRILLRDSLQGDRLKRFQGSDVSIHRTVMKYRLSSIGF